MSRVALVIALLASFVQAQMLSPIAFAPSASAASSNILIVHSATGANGASGSYSVTLPSTTAGNAILCQEADYAGSPGAPSVPTDGGDTFVSDSTLTVASNGRLTYFSVCSGAGGHTTVTMTPASGASSAVCSEVSGLKTSSCFDAAASALNTTASLASWQSSSKAATQTDLAVAATYNRVNNTDTFTAGDVWTGFAPCIGGGHCGNSTDGDQLFVEYILNGWGQFTGEGTINNARTQNTAVALYKSAVAGSAPAGNIVTDYSDFENGSNGNALTPTILAAGSHGLGSSVNLWTQTNSGAGMTVATAAQQNNITANTANGTTYAAAAGTRGIAYTPSSGPTYNLLTLPSSTTTLSTMIQFTMSPNGDNTLYSLLTVNGSGGSDFCDAQTQSSTSIALETKGATSSSITGLTNSASYFAVLTYTSGTPDACTLKIFNSSGVQQGSTLSQNSTGNNSISAVSVDFGQSHNATGPGGTTLDFDNLVVDVTGGTLTP